MSDLAEQIIESVKTGLISNVIDSNEEYRPKLVFNDSSTGNTVLANINKELNRCESFWFSVAFITRSGLITLKETLKDIREKGITGRILTTDYLTFNEPEALRELLSFKNIDVKILTKESFHTKGYMFKNHEEITLIVGSSNLTQYALKENKEWNIKVTSLEEGELIRETVSEFQNMWDEAEVLDHEWINKYEFTYKELKTYRDSQKLVRFKQYILRPNKMQKEALYNLEKLRNECKTKALLISATGERVIIVTGRRNTVNKRVSVA